MLYQVKFYQTSKMVASLIILPLLGIALIILPLFFLTAIKDWFMLLWIGVGFSLMIWAILKLLNTYIMTPCKLQITHDGINISMVKYSIFYPTHIHTPWKAMNNLNMDTDINGNFIQISSTTTPKNYFIIPLNTSESIAQLFTSLDSKRNEMNQTQSTLIKNQSIYSQNWIKILAVASYLTAFVILILKLTIEAKDLSWWSVVFFVGIGLTLRTKSKK